MKFRVPKSSIVLLAVFAVCCCGLGAAAALAKENTVFYLFGVGREVFYPLLLFAALLSLAVALWRMLSYNWGHKVIYGMGIAFAALPIAFHIFFWCLFGVGGIAGYHEFQSPDKAHTIVIEDFSFLQGSHLAFYEKNSFCTMKLIYYASAEDHREKLEMVESIEWQEDGIVVSYPVYNSDEPKKEKIEFLP